MMSKHILFSDDDNDEKSDQETELPMNGGNPSQVFGNPELEQNDDDDDSAPEDIEFTASKTNALKKRKAEKSSAKRLKDESKAKRKKRQEFLSVQSEKKKSRLEELAKKKLPDEFLKNIPDAAEVSTSIEPNVVEVEEKEIEFDSDVKKRKYKNDKKKKKREEKKKKQKEEKTKKPEDELPSNVIVIEDGEDFIPLASNLTEFRVKVAGSEISNLYGNATALIRLKNRLMYGSRHHRESTRDILAKKVKREAAALAAETRKRLSK